MRLVERSAQWCYRFHRSGSRKWTPDGTRPCRWFGGRLPLSGTLEPAGLLAVPRSSPPRRPLERSRAATTTSAGCTSRIHRDHVSTPADLLVGPRKPACTTTTCRREPSRRRGELAEDRLVFGAPGLVRRPTPRTRPSASTPPASTTSETALAGRCRSISLAAAGANGRRRDRRGRLHRQAERAGVGGAARARRRLSRQAARVPQMMTPPPRLSRRARIRSSRPRPTSRGRRPGDAGSRTARCSGRGTGRCGSTRGRWGRRERQADARPQPPGRERRALRYAELERRHHPPGRTAPARRRASPAGRPRSAGVGVRQGVDRAAATGAVRVALDEIDPRGEPGRLDPPRPAGEHPGLRLTDDPARIPARDSDGDGRRARRDVGHAAPSRPDRSHGSIMRSCQRRSARKRSCAQRS